MSSISSGQVASNFLDRPISYNPCELKLAFASNNSVVISEMTQPKFSTFNDILDPVSLVKWSADGQRLFYVELSDSGSPYLSFIESDGITVNLATKALTPIYDIAFTSNPNQLLLAHDRLSFYDMRAPTDSGSYFKDKKVYAVKCHAQDQNIIALGMDDKVQVVDYRKIDTNLAEIAHQGPVKGVDWHHSSYILGSLSGNSLKMNDVSRQQEWSFPTGSLKGCDVKWYNDDTLVTSHFAEQLSAEKTVKVWNFRTTRPIMKELPVESRVIALDVHPIVKTLAAASDLDPIINLFSARDVVIPAMPMSESNLATYCNAVAKHGVLRGTMR